MGEPDGTLVDDLAVAQLVDDAGLENICVHINSGQSFGTTKKVLNIKIGLRVGIALDKVVSSLKIGLLYRRISVYKRSLTADTSQAILGNLCL